MQQPAQRSIKLGIQAFLNGDNQQAYEQFRQAIELAPEHPDGWINMAILHRRAGQLGEAHAFINKAYELRPDSAAVLSNMGSVLGDMYRHDEALEFHKRAVTASPDNQGMGRNHLQALREAGQFEGFLAGCEAYLKRHPDDTSVRWFKAQALFYLQRFPEAWRAIEERWQIANIRGALPTDISWWQGEPLDGRSILVVDEQGFGDSILCSRYIPLLAEQGANVTLLCRPALHDLFKDLPANIVGELAENQPFECAAIIHRFFKSSPDDVGGDPTVSQSFDYATAMMSLPGWFKANLTEAPPASPPVHKDELLPPSLQKPLDEAGEALKVGIVWAGNPEFKRNAQRSAPLSHFADLATVPGVQLFSLQKGPAEAGLESLDDPGAVTPLGLHLGNFTQTAAVIEQLDLIIMTDTSVAHLAGALNKPVWNLLDTCPYWIYGLTGEATGWYPSMRLFRQTQPGDWAPVFASVKSALTALAEEKSG
ncbi:MAG: glycosyltransferase family protein [Alphaproteobacteria bacterium]|nr:glycosyltransferase family protein [Alphaproteobacteria bacterium SS10]